MHDAVTPRLTLKQLRENAGLTQDDLGRRVGVNQNCISQIERGVRRGSVTTMKKIADVLGVTVTDLRNGQHDDRNIKVAS
jgi:DNA-binding XRE family transcriptional regulator